MASDANHYRRELCKKLLKGVLDRLGIESEDVSWSRGQDAMDFLWDQLFPGKPIPTVGDDEVNEHMDHYLAGLRPDQNTSPTKMLRELGYDPECSHYYTLARVKLATSPHISYHPGHQSTWTTKLLNGKIEGNAD